MEKVMSADVPPALVVSLAQGAAASKAAAAAALAGGMIAASGRPHSIEEAMELYQNVYHVMFPSPGHGSYQAFVSKRDSIVKATHV
jgi:hypothetical protein